MRVTAHSDVAVIVVTWWGSFWGDITYGTWRDLSGAVGVACPQLVGCPTVPANRITPYPERWRETAL